MGIRAGITRMFQCGLMTFRLVSHIEGTTNQQFLFVPSGSAFELLINRGYQQLLASGLIFVFTAFAYKPIDTRPEEDIEAR